MLHRCTRLSRTLAVSAKPSPIRRASSASLVNKHHVIPTFRVRDAGSSINDVFSVLKQRIESAPAFYKATPLILDFEGHTEEIASPTTLQTVFQELRGLGIFPIGICNANASTQRVANEAGIPALLTQGKIIQSNGVSQQSSSSPVTSNAAPSTTEAAKEFVGWSRATKPAAGPSGDGSFLNESVVIDRPLRSGQQVYAKDASLVILGNVHSGAEAVADGDVIVMGTLLGRVLAGASGNTKAKVFCMSFKGELISVSSVYKSGDDVSLPIEKPAVIWLQNNQLQFCTFSK